MRNMSDDAKKPDPVDDLRKGFGLLFRAAKTAAEQIPTGKLEKVVVNGVREVGRAIENVTDQLDRQVFGDRGGRAEGAGERGGTVPHPEPPQAGAASPGDVPKADATAPAEAAEKKEDETKEEDEPPKGPRVV
jgi:hypothetical protein